MMSPQAIADLSAEQSRQAAERQRAPAVLFSEETAVDDMRHAPWLGDFVHQAWSKAKYCDFSDVLSPVDYAVFQQEGSEEDDWPWLFVDKSGFGTRSEPCLCYAECVEVLQGLVRRASELHVTLGVGIVEEGQFQCHLALYQK